VGERRETKDLGPGESPGKKRPRALRGLHGPFEGQNLASEFKNFNIFKSLFRWLVRLKEREPSRERVMEGIKRGEIW
jgi:hypothetical protein